MASSSVSYLVSRTTQCMCIQSETSDWVQECTTETTSQSAKVAGHLSSERQYRVKVISMDLEFIPQLHYLQAAYVT